jgi:hypothetical protein
VTVATETIDGAEVRVESGTGTVEKLDRRERNIGVHIRSDNRQMRELVTGWLDSMSLGEDAHPQLVEGCRVEYRIHVRRKAGVDPDVPIAKVASRDKVRDLVRFRVLNAGAESGTRTEPEPEPAATPAAVLSRDTLAGESARLLDLAAGVVDVAADLLPADDPRAARLRSGAGVLRAIGDDLAGVTA